MSRRGRATAIGLKQVSCRLVGPSKQAKSRRRRGNAVAFSFVAQFCRRLGVHAVEKRSCSGIGSGGARGSACRRKRFDALIYRHALKGADEGRLFLAEPLVASVRNAQD